MAERRRPRSDRPIPAGRIGRLARLASLGARTGASLVTSRTGDAAARQAAEVLGNLRGLAAKVGQMASYLDGAVPEEHRAAYEKALAGLRAAAPTSSPLQIRGVVEAELGAPIDRLFARWNDRPIASASIGQVHVALLEDGREVAVKVQHPGIDRAVEADLRNAGVIERMAGLAGAAIGRKLESRRLFDEVAERFREELDYRLEAKHQQSFQKLHTGDPQIQIPNVVSERSSRRVLTTELARGRSFEEAAQGTPEDRLAHARTLWRFVFKGNLVGSMFNADPHPGNYLFGDAGHVTFLDFGCVQIIGREHNREACGLHLSALRRDERAFLEHARRMLGTRPGSYEDFARGFTRLCFEPLFRSPYRITREYVAGLVGRISAAKRMMLTDSGFVQLPPGMVFMNRLQFGFYSVLARFDVEVDYAAVERAFLSEAGIY